MMENYPDELVCDMAETYGVFDVKRVPVPLLATLAVGLRDDSRVKRAKSKTLVDDPTYLLAVIADHLRILAWRMTEDGQNGVDPPKLFTDYYQGINQEPEEPKYLVFDTPGDFRAKWKEITGN